MTALRWTLLIGGLVASAAMVAQEVLPPQQPMVARQVVRRAPLKTSQPLPASDPTNTGNWVLNTAVSDEFTGTTLDPKWYQMGHVGGNTITVGPDPTDSVNGPSCLILTATYAGVTLGGGLSPSYAPGCGVGLGGYNVQGNVPWPTYGYYEAKIKSNAANMSSTFWLWGTDPAGSGWTTEIDIEDGGGHFSNPPAVSAPTVSDYATQEGGVWTYPGHPKPASGVTYSNTGVVFPKVSNMSTGYHTYGLQWDEKYLTWYIDGVQTLQVPNNATSAKGVTPPGNAFNTAMALTMDTSLFTGWYGNPIQSQFPAITYYDYVRVWTKSTKHNPTITWAQPAAITQGTALSGTQLNATANVPGTFTFSPAAGTVLPTGTATLNCTFTPTDTTAYNTATATVSITVNASTLIVPVVCPALNNLIVASATDPTTGANVPGTCSYTSITNEVTVVFTPANPAVYSSVTKTFK